MDLSHSAIQLVFVALTASLGTAVVEAFGPRMPIVGRQSRFLHGLVAGLILWSAYCTLLYRPLVSGLFTLATVTILHAISLGKQRLLNEPLVFSDIALVRMVIRHPSLYYSPGLRSPLVLGAVACAFGAVAWLVALEPALGTDAAWRVFWIALLFCISILIWWSSSDEWIARGIARFTGPPDIRRANARLGLLASLILFALCWRHAKRQQHVVPNLTHFETFQDIHTSEFNDVVVVQFESFVDPSRYFPDRAPGSGLRKARQMAFQWGPLQVPAHGAYTMRTEASVLTGLSGNDLGFEQFDPYLSIETPRVPSLAGLMQQTGSDTIFIHPYDLRFFDRETRLPKLGFERLVGVDAFENAERNGPYVSDVALVGSTLTELDKKSSAMRKLIYAVSMENHGPWQSGRLPNQNTPTETWLAHLASTDLAIADLVQKLSVRRRRTLLLIYGDHTPILPSSIDQQSSLPLTDYVICLLGNDQVRSNTLPVRAATHLHSFEVGQILRHLVMSTQMRE